MGKPPKMPDDDLWDQVARTVRPIDRSDIVLSQDDKAQKSRVTGRKKDAMPQHSTRKVNAEAKPRARDLDRRTETRLKRGQMEVEAVLDLHGATAATGQARLARFLQQCHAADMRCVLVITGKGRTGESGPGILRRSLPGWVSEGVLRDIVLRATPARPQHGGAGAFYILLRRNR